MSKDVSSKTKSGLYWNVSLRIPYEIFRFVTSIIVARLLEPSDFGIVSIATITIYYSNTITNFGFNQALVQRKEVNDDHINSVFTVNLLLSVFLAALFFIISPYIANFFNSPESEDVIKVLSLLFVITTFHDLPYALLRRHIEYKLISMVDFSKEITMSLLTLVLAFAGMKYWAIVLGQLIPLGLATAWLLVKVGWRPKVRLHIASLRELFSFGAWSFISSQAYFFSSRIDRLIIGRALNPAVLGIYDKAKALYQMPVDSISSNINAVLFSSFSRIQDDGHEVKRLLTKGMALLSMINIPIYFALIVAAPHFVLVLFGQKWSALITPLQVLCLGGFFAAINGLIGNYVVSTGNFQKYTVRLIFATVGLFAASAFLVRYGIEAVAAAAVLFSASLFYIGFRIVRERISFSWGELISCILPAFACSVLMFIVMKVAAVFLLAEINFVNLVLLTLVGACVYLPAIAIFPSPVVAELRDSIYVDAAKALKRLGISRTGG